MIRELKDSKLQGRGGAAFPTGVKWEAVAHQPVRPHYLVCNADESEPGHVQGPGADGVRPLRLIEAMTIAAYATGCERGYVYIRGEYPRAPARARRGDRRGGATWLPRRRRARRRLRFEIEVRKGAGAYICGEETAIFESIQGNRGEPRNKPPFPVVEGLFGKPTVVNNVETLVNVLDVVSRSRPVYAETSTILDRHEALLPLGSRRAPRDRTRCLSARRWASCSTLAGGVAGGNELQCILHGRRRGGFLRPDELELPLTFEARPRAKTTLGSSVVLVLDDSVDLPRLLMRIAHILPERVVRSVRACRVGTVRQQESLARLVSGKTIGGPQRELAVIAEVGQCMRDASICGLGQTASSAIESAIDRLRVFSMTDLLLAPKRMIELEIDGQPVRVFEGETILGACRRLGIDTPTLCYGDTLEPATPAACASSRSRAPACSLRPARARPRTG